MVLTMILANGWVTKQVDYTNASAQLDLVEQVDIESPKGFRHRDGIEMVLCLIKSLYDFKQAPNLSLISFVKVSFSKGSNNPH